ncbi:MAG: hypothetical protein AAFY43_01680 [Pseudomonadota bacterium]
MQIIDDILNHKNTRDAGMTLTDEEIAKLADYILSLKQRVDEYASMLTDADAWDD